MNRRRKKLLERFGIIRNAIRKDMLFFAVPFIAVFLLELIFCEIYGVGVSDFWRTVWGIVKHPQSASVLPWRQVAGIALILTGLTIMVSGQATLWRNYSSFVVIKKGHQLITHGVYRFTRNPIYLGVLIVFIGMPVYAASLYGFLIMLVQIPIFLYRIRLEESLLAEEFQDAYRKYKENTKRLIPFIY